MRGRSLEWIEDAKRQATRQDRIRKMIALLEQEKKTR